MNVNDKRYGQPKEEGRRESLRKENPAQCGKRFQGHVENYKNSRSKGI